MSQEVVSERGVMPVWISRWALLRLWLSWWWFRYLRVPLLVVLLSSILALLVGEGVIRALGPLIYKTKIGNVMFTCYQREFPERCIYAEVPSLALSIHQPHLRAECYYNGYFWQHQSDSYGWRNPETWPRVEVALLGDSMIYGHGVEEHQTVAHFLRQELGVKVANQGKMGACASDYLAIYRNFTLPLNPRVTVVFFYSNDLEDLRGVGPEQMDHFIQTGETPLAHRYDRDLLLKEGVVITDVSSWQRMLGRSRLFSLLRYHLPVLRAQPTRVVQDAGLEQLTTPDPAAGLTGIDFQGDPGAWYSRELSFTRRAIATMARSAKMNHSTLVIAYLHSYQDFMREWDEKIPGHLERFAQEFGVPFFHAGRTLADRFGRRPRAGTRLPNDGHLTAEGHRLLAQETAAYLRKLLPAFRQ